MNPGLIGFFIKKALDGLKELGVDKKIEAAIPKVAEKTAEAIERTQTYAQKKVEQLKAMRWVPPPDDPAVKGTMLFEASRKCEVCQKRMRAEAYICPWCAHRYDTAEVQRYVERHRAKLGANFGDGKIQCPRCKAWDLQHAYALGSDIGLWCPHCKDTLQSLRR